MPRPRGKMRTLAWQKIPTTRVVGKDNLWTKVSRLSGNFEMDYDKMDELFSVNRTNSTNGLGQAADRVAGNMKKKENTEINLLDGKRSLNVNIFLKQFRMKHEEIVRQIREGRSDQFGPERLRGLLKLLPSQDEIDAFKGFEGDRDKLGNAEKFFICLMCLPNYRMRIEGLLIMEEFNTNMEWIRPSIEAVLQAAKDIQENTSLRELILLILISGNYLNSGNYAGNAAGFKLSSLLKLTELRANKPRMNLMHYVAQEAEEKNQKLLKFPEEMIYLKEAAQVSIENLNTDISCIANKVRAVTEQMVVAGKDFQMQMSRFLKEANVEVIDLEDDLIDIERMRQELSTFFCEDPQSFKLEECFRTLQTFCERFKKAMDENLQRQIQEAKAERRKQKDCGSKKKDISEPREPTLERVSNQENDGSIVDMLLADVRSGFASRKFNDGKFSVTKVTKVSLSTGDVAVAVVTGTGDATSNTKSLTDDTVSSNFVPGGYSHVIRRTKFEDNSFDSLVEGPSPTPDPLAQRRIRRSYPSGDDDPILDFLMESGGSSADAKKPEAKFDRYASLRRRRQERKETGNVLGVFGARRERAPSPSVLSADTMRLRATEAASIDRPQSEHELHVGSSLRRTRSCFDSSSVDTANAEHRRRTYLDEDADESDALIARIKQRLNKNGKSEGRNTPPITEEPNLNRTDSDTSSRSRWRNGISLSDENSSPDYITEKIPGLNVSAQLADETGRERSRQRLSKRFSNRETSEVKKYHHDFEGTSQLRAQNDSAMSNPSVSVSVRKQISGNMGTNIDQVLKTIEASGRPIDSVGVSGPMKRTPEVSESTQLTLQPVAVVAHVTASNRPITPICEQDLKVKRDKRKKRSTLSMDDIKAAMKRDGPVPEIHVRNSDRLFNSPNNRNIFHVPKSKTPPTNRRSRSNNECKIDDGANNKEISKAAKLAAKKKFRDARFGSSSNRDNGKRARSNVEAVSVDQALKKIANRGNTSRSKSYDEHVAKKGLNGEEEFASNVVMRNSGSGSDTWDAERDVMRKSTSRLSMDGRRNGMYIPSDESDTELKPEDLGNRRSSKSDSPKSLSRLSLKSANTSTETLQADVEYSPEQSRKINRDSLSQNTEQSSDAIYANVAKVTPAPKTEYILPPSPPSTSILEKSEFLRSYSLMDRSRAQHLDDEESDHPLAAVAKWRMKRERKRQSVYDNVRESETNSGTYHLANQNMSSIMPETFSSIHKSDTNDIKNEIGSRNSYASSYSSSNDRDEGFETGSGTMSQRTSLSSTLEAEINGTPTFYRKGDSQNGKQTVNVHESDKTVINDNYVKSCVNADSSNEVETVNRKERTETWTDQTMRVSTTNKVTKDSNTDTSNAYSALSPDSGHITSKEDVWSDDTVSSTSGQSDTSIRQKQEVVSGRKTSSKELYKVTKNKTVPSYMKPTSSSTANKPTGHITNSTAGAGSLPSGSAPSPFRRDTPTRMSYKDREDMPIMKRDLAVRASMKSEGIVPSFQRGTIARTSFRGPRYSLRSPLSDNITSSAKHPSTGSTPSTRQRVDSNASISSTASSVSNVSLSPSKRRLASGSVNIASPNLRPTTPSARSTTPTGRSTTPALCRPKTPSIREGTHSSRPTTPSAKTTTPSPFSRTQSMRVTTSRTVLDGRKDITSTQIPDGRRGITPISHEAKRSTTPLPRDNSRSSTPLSHERPRSTTPLSHDGKPSSRRSSFMAPTAASKAKKDALETTPVVPPRTRPLTTKSITPQFTRSSSLRLSKKSLSTTKQSSELDIERKSPASVESHMHYRSDHHQSLSTVTEQAADEDQEKPEEQNEKSLSLLKRTGITKGKVSSGGSKEATFLTMTASSAAKKK